MQKKMIAILDYGASITKSKFGWTSIKLAHNQSSKLGEAEFK